MAQSDIIAQLVINAQISPQEPIYINLNTLVDQAYNEYKQDNRLDYSLLQSVEYELVLLLAWERVCLARASFVAPQQSTKGAGAQGFGSDRDTPFAKNMALAKQLRSQFEFLRDRLTPNDDDENFTGDITVGEFFRQEELVGAKVPIRSSPPLPPPILQNQGQTPDTGGGVGTVLIGWPSFRSSYLYNVRVYSSTVAGLYQPWNNACTQEGIPLLDNVNATLLYTTTDTIHKTVKVINLISGTTYNFIAVVQDTSGNYTYSPVLSVLIAA